MRRNPRIEHAGAVYHVTSRGQRRVWCFGSEGFREDMVERVAEVLRGKRRSSYAGGAVRRHDEYEAESLAES